MMYIDEKLTASDPTSKWISDFVHSDNPKFAGKSKKERIRMALGASYAAKGKSRNEETELDEVSMGLLTRYKEKAGQQASAMNKAVGDVATSSAAPEHKKTAIDTLVQKGNKRFSGIVRATNKQFAKTTKEEVENIDELRKSTLASYVNKAAQDKAETANTSGFRAGVKEPAYNTSDESDREMKRTKGINRAVSKLAKEEVEELDEISKKTLGSYVSKAAVDMTNKTADATQKRTMAGADYAHNISRGMNVKTAEKHMKADYDDAKPDTKKALKRMAGIDKAVSRLTKEEVEELDELSKSTLASYAKKATHDARMKMATGKDFERVGANTRKPEYKAGAKKWEDKYKSDARRREAGTMKAIDRLAKEEVELDEATPTAQQVKQAIGIARDKRYAQGNVTGAVKAMNKINKGLAQHPSVQKELQKQNEDIESVDEVTKATGGLKKACWKGYTAVGLKKKGGRMVPNCVPIKDETELKTFKQLKEELNGNS